jgi:benzoylformate decarboxylase
MRGTDRFLGMDFNKPELDFVALARGMGVDAKRIDTPTALPDALKQSISSGRPSLLDVVIYSETPRSPPRSPPRFGLVAHWDRDVAVSA